MIMTVVQMKGAHDKEVSMHTRIVHLMENKIDGRERTRSTALLRVRDSDIVHFRGFHCFDECKNHD